MTTTNNPNSLLQDLKAQSKEGEISTAAAIQLIMTSLISLDANVTKLGTEFECSSDSNDKFQNQLTKRVDDLGTKVESLSQDLKENRAMVEVIAKQTENWCLPNPMLAFGCFIKNNPKLFMGLITAGLALILLLSIPQVKHSLIIFVGFPKEFAEFLAPIP